MKLRFAASTWDTSADQSFTLDDVAPPNTTDFHTSKDEGHLHHAELGNLAAMARSIFHQVGATEVAHPELTTLVNFDDVDGARPFGSLIADAQGDLFGTTQVGGGTNSDYGTARCSRSPKPPTAMPAPPLPWSALTALTVPNR